MKAKKIEELIKRLENKKEELGNQMLALSKEKKDSECRMTLETQALFYRTKERRDSIVYALQRAYRLFQKANR